MVIKLLTKIVDVLILLTLTITGKKNKTEGRKEFFTANVHRLPCNIIIPDR